MKILLIGSDGQLGYEFKRLFDSLNKEYIATDYQNLDITDEKALNNFFTIHKDITHIINCAAYNDVDKAESEDDKVRLLNTEAPKKLAEISKNINAVYTTYSTDFVFDGEKGKPYIEEDKINPLCKYAESKAEGEKKVFETYDKSFIIRTSWLFGIGNNNFSKQIINWSKIQDTLKVVDDQISAPTYSKDLALFSWKLIQTRKYGMYHISSNGVASKYDQAKYILDKIGWKGKLEKARTFDFKLPAKRSKYSKLDSGKIERLLGEKIPDWKNGIDRFLEEKKEKGEL